MAQVYSPWHAFIRLVNRLKRRSRRTVGATRPGAANNPSAGTLHRYFGQPGIQKFHLLGSGIDERYAHAHAVLDAFDNVPTSEATRLLRGWREAPSHAA